MLLVVLLGSMRFKIPLLTVIPIKVKFFGKSCRIIWLSQIK